MAPGAKLVQKALSDLTIANLKKPGYYWDKLPGFGIRVGARRKTFIAVRKGRRTTLGVYPHLCLADARILATQALYTVTSVKSKATVKQASDAYLDQLTLRPRTVAEYTRFLTDYMLPKIGTKPVGKVTSTDILGITDSLKATPAECRHTHAAMQTFFNWCVPRYLSQSPMAGLKNPAKPKKRSRILADDELKAIWSACCDRENELADQFRSIVKLLILTGQRRGEIAALQGIFYAHNQQTITLPDTLTKNKREHTFPLCAQAIAMINGLRSTKGLWFPVEGKNGKEAVFSAWSKNKKLLDKHSKCSRYTLHDFRRTYRSSLGRLGVRPDIAERLVNHVDARTDMEETYDVYTYLPEMRKATDLWQEHIAKLLL